MSDLSYRAKRIAELEERRKKRTMSAGPNYRLGIPEHLKDPNLEYRWSNDDAKGNIYSRTNVDTWDFVTNDEIALDDRNSGAGTRIERVVGADKEGKPQKAFLLCKPKKWVREDRERRNRPHEELMQQIHAKPVPLGGEADLSTDEEHAYVPREARLPAGVKSGASGIRRRA